QGARALAWLQGQEFVLPQHVQQVAPNILRHRIVLSFEAEAAGVTADQVIARLLEVVAIHYYDTRAAAPHHGPVAALPGIGAVSRCIAWCATGGGQHTAGALGHAFSWPGNGI